MKESNHALSLRQGCLLGAILILFVGDSLGRRVSTFWGTAIIIVSILYIILSLT